MGVLHTIMSSRYPCVDFLDRAQRSPKQHSHSSKSRSGKPSEDQCEASAILRRPCANVLC